MQIIDYKQALLSIAAHYKLYALFDELAISSWHLMLVKMWM